MMANHQTSTLRIANVDIMVQVRSEMKALVAVYILAMLCSSAKAYSSGAPEVTCDSMTPSHDVSGQITQIPYQVSFSESSVEGGARVKITLRPTGAERFKGFLVKAVDSSSETQTLGTFDVSGSGPNAKSISCSPGTNNNAVTHTNGNGKTEVAFDWIAPSDFNGNVRFLYTVVQIKSTFWVKGKSEDLAVSANSLRNSPQHAETPKVSAQKINLTEIGMVDPATTPLPCPPDTTSEQPITTTTPSKGGSGALHVSILWVLLNLAFAITNT